MYIRISWQYLPLVEQFFLQGTSMNFTFFFLQHSYWFTHTPIYSFQYAWKKLVVPCRFHEHFTTLQLLFLYGICHSCVGWLNLYNKHSWTQCTQRPFTSLTFLLLLMNYNLSPFVANITTSLLSLLHWTLLFWTHNKYFLPLRDHTTLTKLLSLTHFLSNLLKQDLPDTLRLS